MFTYTHQEKPKLAAFITESDKGPTAPSKAYEADAESMIKKLQPSDNQAEKKIKPKVDSKCMAASTGYVLYKPLCTEHKIFHNHFYNHLQFFTIFILLLLF